MKKNYIYAFVTVVIWATMAPVVKVLMGDMPDLQALGIGSLFAFIFLFILNAATGRLKKMREYSPKDIAKMAGLGFLGLFLYTYLYYFGIGRLTSQEACILNYLWPIMLMIFSCIILKESFTVRKVAAMLSSFLGIVVLTSGSGGAGGEGRIAGIAACIAGAACYGLFAVLNKKADMDQNLTMMVIWLTTAVCSFAAGLPTGTWAPVRGFQWLGLIWLGAAVNAVAYLLWALALKGTENTAIIANLAYLTPFLSVMISALFLKERLHITAVAALVLIVGGILIQSIPASANKASADTASQEGVAAGRRPASSGSEKSPGKSDDA
jgi:drug/metabolite transporter (DMT)-like permease